MTEHPDGETADVALWKTLRDADLGSFGIDMAEVGLDAFMSDGVWRDIPAIRSVVQIIKAGMSVRDYRLARNIARFLTELSSINAATRRDMIERLEADPKFGARVGELLIGILDRCDDARKPALHGRAFAMYCRREIAADRLRRLHVVIDAVHLPEVDRLVLSTVSTLSATLDPRHSFDPFSAHNLTQAGVLILQNHAVRDSTTVLTYEGTLLLKVMGRLNDERVTPVW
ncbi:MAG TPA: hypothetical protein VHB78_15980 [Vicinamibacterales bacterium]|jgi:hypothetical protein|nr:hypothetical protein [Vicinamibacterales bacterium]